MAQKKVAAQLADLKRQLQQERRRNERVEQELAETKLQVIPTPMDLADRMSGNGSVRSSAELSRSAPPAAPAERAPAASVGGSVYGSNFVTYEQLLADNNALTKRISQLQQEREQMSERVQYLEEANRGLVDDVTKKSFIIHSYAMSAGERIGGSPGAASHRKGVVGLAAEEASILLRHATSGARNNEFAEVNRRLQSALEEALTKNVQLQQDIDTLGNEIMRLTRLLQAQRGAA